MIVGIEASMETLIRLDDFLTSSNIIEKVKLSVAEADLVCCTCCP